jgi:hypothetical protein
MMQREVHYGLARQQKKSPSLQSAQGQEKTSEREKKNKKRKRKKEEKKMMEGAKR